MSPNNEPWYLIEAIDTIDSPALVVYLDRAKENIERLKKGIDDVQRLRPHIKTHKSKEAAALLLHAGIKKFKCATIAEAEMLAQIGAPDVVLAYQPVGPKALRFISLIKKYPDTAFSCLVDNASAAHYLSTCGQEACVSLPVFIDVNVGMNRTGISPDKVVELFTYCASLPGINPIGLHVYDGHITDAGLAARTEKCNAAFAPVESIRGALLKKGFAQPVVIAGGSATFPIHAKRPGVECSPGTTIYWDAGYAQLLPEEPFEPAAVVLTRIISMPDSQTICTDLGHKSIASESGLDKRVFFLNAPELQPVGHSEEHLVLKAAANHRYKIGDVLFGVPWHICPTVALYEKTFVVENRMVVAEWKVVSRDRTLTV